MIENGECVGARGRDRVFTYPSKKPPSLVHADPRQTYKDEHISRRTIWRMKCFIYFQRARIIASCTYINVIYIGHVLTEKERIEEKYYLLINVMILYRFGPVIIISLNTLR